MNFLCHLRLCIAQCGIKRANEYRFPSLIFSHIQHYCKLFPVFNMFCTLCVESASVFKNMVIFKSRCLWGRESLRRFDIKLVLIYIRSLQPYRKKNIQLFKAWNLFFFPFFHFGRPWNQCCGSAWFQCGSGHSILGQCGSSSESRGLMTNQVKQIYSLKFIFFLKFQLTHT